ncbi:Segregation and condensation protein A [Piscirickettsia salmonis]|uniref:Segregation and condensation protein A n=1 Tax=Piscirickettsia salmonis TaxID=1238 RepID=A0A1L6T9C7_PISSA|nr:segregation/condensation protein A [Piscirickettsia salmonis]AKP73122.1 segregation and condensation protein A [Piscirickettsia salmonis LF-89 = ATCC VR-1361]ALB21779.1 chromosome segregation/condensation protein ScpA [Piscirickettsia salmonis]ALY01964.1 segregation and condensation protein A [Piscirickettsia salmonis]AMA41473.1 segregation and condensation protein A [Piscirickettsia salmonis]AOS33960.1 segregation and condensation protein A [Piscirickettsia salmonis]
MNEMAELLPEILPDAIEVKPIARVAEEWVTQVPRDLYIPPDALKVFLEAFEGPLDLLLYLIRKQNMDILDIPIAKITAQYMEYIRLMEEVQFELAAEYLVMAAMLAEIKSRMLLPRPETAEGEEEDPRAELVRRLQEYERFRQAAEEIDELPRLGRDYFQASADHSVVMANHHQVIKSEIDFNELIAALREVMQRAEMFSSHQIQREALSVRERMGAVLERLNSEKFTPFFALFTLAEGRQGVVVTFLAILELVKNTLIELVQHEASTLIHVRLIAHAE